VIRENAIQKVLRLLKGSHDGNVAGAFSFAV